VGFTQPTRLPAAVASRTVRSEPRQFAPRLGGLYVDDCSADLGTASRWGSAYLALQSKLGLLPEWGIGLDCIDPYRARHQRPNVSTGASDEAAGTELP